MKKTLIYALAAAVAVLSSCTREAPVKKTGVFSISFGPDSKLYMNYQGHNFWTPKDQISVFSDQGTCKTFIACTKEGANSSDFICYDWILEEIPKWAVFCYEEKRSPSNPYNVIMTEEGVFSANVSCYQPVTVSHSFGSFGSKANVAVAAIYKEGKYYRGLMKNALGLVKITIPSGLENISEIILEDADGTAPIAGKVMIDCTGDAPVCTPVVGEGKSSIRANWDKKPAVSFTAGIPVYFCVIPNVSFTPKFTFIRTDGYEASVTESEPVFVSTNRAVDCGTPESLDFSKVVTLTFGENPFNEIIPAPSVWNAGAMTYSLTLKGDAKFSYKLKNSDVAKDGGTYSSYQLMSGYSQLVFWGHANADGTEYFQIDSPTGGKIANVSVELETNKDMTVTDLTGEVIASVTPPFSRDLTGTTAAYGCRLKFSKAQDYKFTSIKITYIPE